MDILRHRRRSGKTDEPVNRIQDDLCGTKILRYNNLSDRGIQFHETEDIRNRGPEELIDGLVIISYHGDVGLSPTQHSNKLKLRIVRVLKIGIETQLQSKFPQDVICLFFMRDTCRSHHTIPQPSI